VPGTSYDRAYLEACRAQVSERTAAYADLSLAAAAIKGSARTRVNGALVALEPLLFNSLVVVLDTCFARRDAGIAACPALDEVRVLAVAIVGNDAVLHDDDALPAPHDCVLGLKPGDPISLTENDFRRLATAYFDAAERGLLAA
jgi:hypothetical protein